MFHRMWIDRDSLIVTSQDELSRRVSEELQGVEVRLEILSSKMLLTFLPACLLGYLLSDSWLARSPVGVLQDRPQY